ncbi:Lyzozyme M1 (1,4-beta-N-acetylmuramidase), GH25 family [Nakamurella panacisegetis]|uniref:lysozyme n=2 Tax=Nakamurella panacisegetis TaxID=1090615 RepID=A0A1H0QLS2_9ACTN|nr:Lyzozyme M1 (1,4-beta-N-acetylmuramidase), GH25 family [Nakamurella panacisegetis]
MLGSLYFGPGVANAAASWVHPASAVASTTVTPVGIDEQMERARTRFAANARTAHPGEPEVLSHPVLEGTRPGAGRSVNTGPLSRIPRTGALTTSGPTEPGVDVSGYQGNVFWSQVVAEGATFAYVKATEGTGYRSGYFAQQYNGSYSAGLERGAYHFAIPDNSTGATQADYFVANGGGWTADGRTLPGMLDIEYNPYGAECFGLTQSQMVNWLASFDFEYRTLTGRSPDIYTTTDWWTTCTGNSGAFAKESLSIANYSGSPYPLPASWGSYNFWQFADSGVFPGDQERFNGDHQALVSFADGVPIPPLQQTRVISLRAAVNGRFVTAESGGAAALIANRTAIGQWEQFDLISVGTTQVALRAHADNRFVCADRAGTVPLIANRTAVGLWETFTIVPQPDKTVALRAAVNGRYVTAELAGTRPLIANRTAVGAWEKFTIVSP